MITEHVYQTLCIFKKERGKFVESKLHLQYLFSNYELIEVIFTLSFLYDSLRKPVLEKISLIDNCIFEFATPIKSNNLSSSCRH